MMMSKKKQTKGNSSVGEEALDPEEEALERAEGLVMGEGEIEYLLEVLKRRQEDPLAEVLKVTTLKRYFERA